MLGGSRGALIEDSGTRCFHSAHAIRTGVAATLAAARGIDATMADLDRRQGVLGSLDPDRLRVGAERALAESSLRVFETSGWNQTAYEAATEAADGSRGRIAAVLIRTPSAAHLLDLIELQPDTGPTSVRIEASERSAEAAVDLPLDHPDRPATLAQLAALKWRCPPAEAADRVGRIAAELAGEEST